MPILTLNSGSSSLKLGLYTDDGETVLLTADLDGIGNASGGNLKLTAADESPLVDTGIAYADIDQAFEGALRQMQHHVPEPVTAVGHRMVHGGPHLVTHQRLTKRVLQTLRDSVHFAPLHIPPALDLVQFVERQLPGIPQFACFDTVFHQTMLPEAYTYAIPKAYRDAGIRRYGFHGLSFESIVHALGDAVPARTVVAHLGGGSSACALLHGKSVDTSMGVSPTGGLVMSTRTGDLDPGVVLLMERSLGAGVPVLSADELETALNKESGLKALAGDGDMRKLTARTDKHDADATLAVDVFCRTVAKTIAGYATVLGGVDLLVFTGGIGEHSALIRQRICGLLAVIGVLLDAAPPATGIVSPADAAVAVRVIPADENAMIALHVATLAS